jgi:hypothetical protein
MMKLVGWVVHNWHERHLEEKETTLFVFAATHPVFDPSFARVADQLLPVGRLPLSFLPDDCFSEINLQRLEMRSVAGQYCVWRTLPEFDFVAVFWKR